MIAYQFQPTFYYFRKGNKQSEHFLNAIWGIGEYVGPKRKLMDATETESFSSISTTHFRFVAERISVSGRQFEISRRIRKMKPYRSIRGSDFHELIPENWDRSIACCWKKIRKVISESRKDWLAEDLRSMLMTFQDVIWSVKFEFKICFGKLRCQVPLNSFDVSLPHNP